VIDRGHILLGVILALALGVGAAGWLRALEPKPQTDRFAQTLAGVRLFYELQDQTVEQIQVDRFVGPNAYATVRTSYMPTAMRVRVTQQEGWRVLDVTPIRNSVMGP
jgi:hypothetical protein